MGRITDLAATSKLSWKTAQLYVCPIVLQYKRKKQTKQFIYVKFREKNFSSSIHAATPQLMTLKLSQKNFEDVSKVNSFWKRHTSQKLSIRTYKYLPTKWSQLWLELYQFISFLFAFCDTGKSHIDSDSLPDETRLFSVLLFKLVNYRSQLSLN